MRNFDMPKTGSWEQRGGWVVRQLCADLQLSQEQAAGLVGNLGYESIGFTTLQEIKPLVEGSAGGFGWAQWTGPRRRKFEAWTRESGLALSSDEANYGFLLHELTGDYRTFMSRLSACATIEDACRLTHKLYETPADVLDGSYRSGPARLKYARRALAGARAATPGNGGPIAQSEPPPVPAASTPPPDPAPRRNPILAALARLFSFLRSRNG